MKLLSFRLLLLGLALVLAPAAFSFRSPDLPQLPNLDKRKPHAAMRKHADKRAAEAELKKHLPRVKVDFDEVTGAPRSISTPDGFLTGAGGKGRAVSPKAAAAFAANEPNRVTKAFLQEHKGLFGHGAEVLNDASVKREFVTAHNGMKTVIWEQQLDGIPVFEAVLISHTTKKEELVTLSSQFLPNPARAADAGVANRKVLQLTPKINAQRAVVLAARNVGEEIEETAVSAADEPAGPQRKQRFTAGKLPGDSETRLVWLPITAEAMRLCWEVTVTSAARGETFQVLVDAENGEVMVRRNLTHYLTETTYHVFHSDSPSPMSPGHATPLTNQPPIVARQMITLRALNTNASPLGWITDGDTDTRGNNVHAHCDADKNNLPDLPRPQMSTNRVFDFPINLEAAPSTYANASVVQLFYWCNWMHDKLYELGFTEAAGNFQTDNFSRGGFGNDPLQADAQDSASRNNAKFTTPLADGASPRMELYLFGSGELDRDSALDAEIILHEYTHGLSNRRVGGGIGLSTLQGAGMGEGWSDFYALALLSESGDDIGGNYPQAAYASYDVAPDFRENYYYGIRRYPYSTNMSVNPLTFKDIDPSQESAHVGIPRSPALGGPPSERGDKVHYQGEVWCSALWEARANLIAKYGFAVGNQTILQLVTDGMNLCPPNPTFIQARDAILQADQVSHAGANFHELWAAFAKRGMGYFASAPASTTTSNVVESFALPDHLYITSEEGLISSGAVGGPFAPFQRTYTLTNVGATTFDWSISTSTNWLSFSQTNGTFNGGGSATVTVSIALPVATLLPAGVYTNQVYFTNETSGIGQTRTFLLLVGQADRLTEVFAKNDFDLGYRTFTFSPDGSASFYSVCQEPASVFPTDPTGGSVVQFTGSSAPQDDGYAQVTLSSNVSIYDTTNNVFFIGSNGYLTMNSGDTEYSGELGDHMNRPRISALFYDLNTSNAVVSWKQLSNRVAVTFWEVPEYGIRNTNNFQVEMFFDGRIRVTYLKIEARNALVGLSPGGGVPAGFIESNFSSYSECAPRPVVTIPSAAEEGQGTLSGVGTVTFPAPHPTNVTVTFFSSDATEVGAPTAATLLAGETNLVFDLTITDDEQLDGTRTAVITVLAPGYLSGSASILVHDNESATLTVDLPDSISEADGDVPGAVMVDVAPDSDVIVSLGSSLPSEFEVPATVVIPAGQTSSAFNAVARNNKAIDGTRLVTVTAQVTNWVAGVDEVSISDNENTQLVLSLPDPVREGNGVLPLSGMVGISGTLTTNLDVALTSGDASVFAVPSSVTVLAGQTCVVFDVTVADNSTLEGSTTIDVDAAAVGFSGATSEVTVTDDELPLPPISPFPPHLSSNNAVTVNLSWTPGLGEGSELLTNGGFELGNAQGWIPQPGSGNILITNGDYTPLSSDDATTPFSGAFSALFEQASVGQQVLYREIALPVAEVITFAWADRIRNQGSAFSTDHQFRVELRGTNDAALQTLYSTVSGQQAMNEWTERQFDISSYRGQTVRLAFVVIADGPFLDVHLDAVSVRSANPPLTTYDIYFGTNPVPDVAEFLGSTTNLSWDLPTLDLLQTYFWKVVARRLGETSSPIWQFKTAPYVSILDTTIVEGDATSTNVTVTAVLSAPSDQMVTIGFVTQSGTAMEGEDFTSTSGSFEFPVGETNATVTIPILGELVYEADETFSVLLTSSPLAAIADASATITISNDDPILAPISDKTVNENTTLTFTAQAYLSQPTPIEVITGFETFPTNSADGSVMFRNPRSSTTSGLLDGTPNFSRVTDNFPAGNGSGKVLRSSWSYNGSTAAWLRLITGGVASLPNPTIDFTQVLQFKIYSEKPLYVGLGLRESNTGAAIGADGGTTGSIEFVGITNYTGNLPYPVRLITASNWQTLSFDIPHELLTNSPFGSPTPNGILESSTGKGVLEHLAFIPANSTNRLNNIYLDDFCVVYSNLLTFTLENAPPGASIHPNTGVFTWTPTEAQGPGVYTVTVHVSDSSTPPVTASRTFDITVDEVNSTPILTGVPVAPIAINENAPFTLQTGVNDSDLPTNEVIFSLVDAPEGVTIDEDTGLLSWTPTEAQGPGYYSFTVVVTDDGSPALFNSNVIQFNVGEVNSAPVLQPISDITVEPGTPISFSVYADDYDLPANTLSFSLLAGAPDGSSIDPIYGVFSWTPTEANPGTNVVTVRVTDDGTPNLTNTTTFNVIVLCEPLIVSIDVDETVVNLTWNAIAGRTYRVQYKNSLEAAMWEDLPGDIVANETTATKSDTLDQETGRFYRVTVVPEP